MTDDPVTEVEPLRVAFRRQVREQALDVAHRLTLERGWDLVRVGEVAVAAGVSRPTIYKEFGNKQGIGEALVLRETDRFLAGIAERLSEHEGDPGTGIATAVEFTLREAADNPLLHAVLTSTRGGADALLPLLTTRSAPVLEASSAVLTGWFCAQFPDMEPQVVAEGVDALVRLTVSHLVLPAAPPAETAARLAGLAVRFLPVPDRAAG